MAVVTTGNETIVRYGTWRIVLFYVLSGASAIIAVLSVVVAPGGVVLVSWGLGALSFALMGIQMYTIARAYANTWVAVGPDAARLKLSGPAGTGTGTALFNTETATREAAR